MAGNKLPDPLRRIFVGNENKLLPRNIALRMMSNKSEENLLLHHYHFTEINFIVEFLFSAENDSNESRASSSFPFQHKARQLDSRMQQPQWDSFLTRKQAIIMGDPECKAKSVFINSLEINFEQIYEMVKIEGTM